MNDTIVPLPDRQVGVVVGSQVDEEEDNGELSLEEKCVWGIFYLNVFIVSGGGKWSREWAVAGWMGDQKKARQNI